jgi:hypothetical protein
VKTRAFVSFDLDHDNDLKLRLCDQAGAPNSRVDVFDWSVRETADDWHDKLRKRVSNVDLVLVVCGAYTDRAANVNTEVELAREANVPYLLLDGRPDLAQVPAAARQAQGLVEWQPHTLATLGTSVSAPNLAHATDDNLLPSSRLTSRRRRNR